MTDTVIPELSFCIQCQCLSGYWKWQNCMTDLNCHYVDECFPTTLQANFQIFTSVAYCKRVLYRLCLPAQHQCSVLLKCQQHSGINLLFYYQSSANKTHFACVFHVAHYKARMGYFVPLTPAMAYWSERRRRTMNDAKFCWEQASCLCWGLIISFRVSMSTGAEFS